VKEFRQYIHPFCYNTGMWRTDAELDAVRTYSNSGARTRTWNLIMWAQSMVWV